MWMGLSRGINLPLLLLAIVLENKKFMLFFLRLARNCLCFFIAETQTMQKIGNSAKGIAHVITIFDVSGDFFGTQAKILLVVVR